MRNVKRILCLLLALCMALSFFACEKDSGTPAGTEGSSAITEGADDGKIVLIDKGVCRFQLSRADAAKTDSQQVLTTVEIKRALTEYCAEGQSVPITTDWLNTGKGETHDPEIPEILVGKTNYDETAAAAEGVSDIAYKCCVVGKKIILYAVAEDSLERVGQMFVALLASHAEKDADGLYTVALSEEELTFGGELNRPAAEVPQPEGAELETFYNPGDGCDEAVYKSATRALYDAYIEKMKAEGFTVFASSEKNGNPFATLYNEYYTVNTGFYVYEKRIRTIVESKTPQSLCFAEADNQYETVTTSLITMLGVEYTKTDGGQENTGACLIVRLCDGRFVIFDGGHNRTQTMNNIIAVLKDQSKDYADKTGGIKVAAWVITHPHGDHFGALGNHADLLKTNKITVENLMYHFMDKAQCVADGCSFSYDLMPNVARNLKANVIVPHVGQTYYIANMVMEPLCNVESLVITRGGVMTDQVTDLNNVSLTAKLTITDPQTQKKTTFMTLGDAAGCEMRAMANTFGTYLESDISQIAHHGAGTKGDDAGTVMGYKAIKPYTVLWTSGTGAYDSGKSTAYRYQTRNLGALDTKQNPNFKEVYVAGLSGKATVLTVPYTVGSAKIQNYQ